MSYLAELRAIAEEEQRESKLRKDINTAVQLNKQRELARRSKPLTEQITELMNALPPQLRDRPWSMAELVSRLTGKYRERPHAQHVGEALRILGFRYERRWQKGFDGRRLWIPPTRSQLPG